MSENIDAMVKTIIQTQVLQALRSAPDAVEAMVQAALSKPVDEHSGRHDDRSYGKKIPYLEWIVGDAIRQAATQAVLETIAAMKPQIAELVRAKLQGEDIVSAFAKAVTKAVDEDWRIDVEFKKVRGSD